ncbi:hypothetical protein DYB25_011517 [Aphanomyces astaci]|uniref:Uncharacterized protein n=1 Tax=Aphanomyces astaci TaxID=112090 RepID=A0A397A4D5_APHAT|nr:hypothetical protein DYB25_011517 [Aphanomyces astaci]
MESSHRRQERLRDKTQIEQRKGEWLRRTFEEKKQLEDKKRERDLDRSRRRLHNASAARIQRTWRRSYHKRLYWRLLNHAAALIQVAMRDYTLHQHAIRFQSAVTLQRWWHLVFFRRQRRTAQDRILNGMYRHVLQRRGRRFRLQLAAALIIQRTWMRYWHGIKAAAAATIQRCARRRQRKRQMKRLASIHLHLQTTERMDASARVLQRNMALWAVTARLVSDADFQRVLQLTKQPKGHSVVTDDVPHEGLAKAAADEVKLQRLKATLLRDIDDLRRVRVPKATQQRNDEQESLRRLKALESQRLAKDKEREVERLRQVEDHTRRGIRWELEKQLDHQRRVKMKQGKVHRDSNNAGGGGASGTKGRIDCRVEVE